MLSSLAQQNIQGRRVVVKYAIGKMRRGSDARSDHKTDIPISGHTHDLKTLFAVRNAAYKIWGIRRALGQHRACGRQPHITSCSDLARCRACANAETAHRVREREPTPQLIKQQRDVSPAHLTALRPRSTTAAAQLPPKPCDRSLEPRRKTRRASLTAWFAISRPPRPSPRSRTCSSWRSRARPPPCGRNCPAARHPSTPHPTRWPLRSSTQ